MLELFDLNVFNKNKCVGCDGRQLRIIECLVLFLPSGVLNHFVAGVLNRFFDLCEELIRLGLDNFFLLFTVYVAIVKILMEPPYNLFLTITNLEILNINSILPDLTTAIVVRTLVYISAATREPMV